MILRSASTTPRHAADATTARRGFTLIELLVVVTIIIVIVSIMMPAINNARETANVARCSSNYHQIMYTCLSYASDSRSAMPFPNWLSLESGAWTGLGWLYKPNAGSTFYNPTDYKGGIVWQYSQSSDLLRCPSHLPTRTGTTEMLTSYNENGSVCGYSRNGDAIGMFKIPQFKADDILFWETNEYIDSWNDGSNTPPEYISSRHIDRGVVANADGSTSWVTFIDFQTWTVSGVKNRVWNVPNTANGH